MKRTNVHMTDQQRSRLQQLSEKTGLNVAEHVRRAIDHYLDTEEATMRDREMAQVEQQR